ncbi:hypothetical protein ANCCAN_04344 [Ancylostoma caninum]|uniref:Uncharacterized protein n=1 Tax=Ancylostoma caninum TaxID=29170 RepID=A0A368GYZ1_ANCCA|nr:hypothetical protein ANCCAN_04344 [Ancylostoma caninum]
MRWVRDLPLVESSEKVEYIPIPPDYGYAAPRLIFAFTTFGNKILGKGESIQRLSRKQHIVRMEIHCDLTDSS